MSEEQHHAVNSLGDVATRLSAVLDAQLAPLQQLVSRLSALGSRSRRGLLTHAGVSALSGEVEAAIVRSERMVGHGFIAAPTVVEGYERYMLWLQRKNGKLYRLRLNIDPGDPDAYDYLTMEWYARAIAGDSAVLTGPYLDYSGSNHFVFTFTLPARLDDTLLGVVATDMLVHQAEVEFVRILKKAGGEAVLVNTDRIVVAANSVRWIPGERLPSRPDRDPANFPVVIPLSEWTGWCVALGVDFPRDAVGGQ